MTAFKYTYGFPRLEISLSGSESLKKGPKVSAQYISGIILNHSLGALGSQRRYVQQANLREGSEPREMVLRVPKYWTLRAQEHGKVTSDFDSRWAAPGLN